MPPTRNSDCRDSSEIHVASSVCSTARSAERRLVSSPVRRSVKKPGDSRTRCANTSSRSFATTRSAVLVSRYTCTKFITPCSANAAIRHERDPVEQRAVVLLERGVEQVAARRRGRRVPTAAATSRQTRADDEPPAIRTDARHERLERSGSDGRGADFDARPSGAAGARSRQCVASPRPRSQCRTRRRAIG